MPTIQNHHKNNPHSNAQINHSSNYNQVTHTKIDLKTKIYKEEDNWKISLDLSSLELGLRSSITLSSTVEKSRNCRILEFPNICQKGTEAVSSAIEVCAIALVQIGKQKGFSNFDNKLACKQNGPEGISFISKEGCQNHQSNVEKFHQNLYFPIPVGSLYEQARLSTHPHMTQNVKKIHVISMLRASYGPLSVVKGKASTIKALKIS